jgi:hypothetical protein
MLDASDPEVEEAQGMAHHRAALLATGLLAVLTACSGLADTPQADGPTTRPSQVEADAPDGSVSALEDRFDPRLPEPLIPPDLVQSGGPPPDGIPPIDEPTFEPADAVTWLEPDEPVLSLTVEDETRAYPLRVMTWHEIVNDTVAGIPVAVTYCPLCNSGVAFLRETDGRVLSFGTSGMLYADNLVMYDRQTESLWPQLTGQASIGVLTGEELEAIPMGTVAWSEFRDAHPTALVLSQDTGFDRPYGSNPYVGYDDPDGDLLFGVPGELDERLPVKERVIGLGQGSDAVAVVRSGLAGRAPLEVTVGDRPVVLWHRPGQASALDTPDIAGGENIGTVGVFDPVLDGQHLHFTSRRGVLEDEETGSRWDVLGRAFAGPLKGSQLEPFQHLDTFWFAWVTFNPDTELIDADVEGNGQ